MRALIFSSICTGGGLADIGAMQSGLQPAWGIEIDPRVAEIASHNLKHTVHAQNVVDTNWSKLDKPDVLWASPPCPNFSNAKRSGKETALDRAIAQSIVDAVKTYVPRVFILENVQGYSKSKSLQFIEGALYGLGYWCDRQIWNAADHGVPQSRKRLILRAVHNGFPAPMPAKQQWIGWHQAIEDLIPSLPESEFAPWQLERMPDELKTAWYPEEPQTFLTETKFPNRNAKRIWRSVDERSPTVTSLNPNWRAFLVSDKGSESPAITVRHADEPTFSVVKGNGSGGQKAFLVHPTDQRTMPIKDESKPSFTLTTNQGGNAIKAWLEHGRVVRMTTQALGRFQTLPDWYEQADCGIIGNGVPCKLAKTVVESCGEVQ